MLSYLGEFQGSAKDRPAKLRRATESVRAQTFKGWELLIVADGCEATHAMGEEYTDPNIRFFPIPKQPRWSGLVRNAGIFKAGGVYVIYLDSDDRYGRDHLQVIHDGLKAHSYPPWASTDEFVWDGEQWATRSVQSLLKAKKAGTSNIVHRRDLGVYWPEPTRRSPGYGYGEDDRGVIRVLETFGPPAYIAGGQYYVMHIPGRYDL